MGPIVLSLGVAFIVVILSQLIFTSLQANPQKEKIQSLVKESGYVDQYGEDYEGGGMLEGDLTPMAEKIQALFEGFGFNVSKYRKEKALVYYQAGFTSSSTPMYFLFAKWVGQPLAGLFAINMLLNADGMQTKLIAVILLVLAVKGVDLFITNQKQKRQKKLQNSFPDALDLLLVCVETGLALDGALGRVCSELAHAHPEIAYEFNRLRIELSLLNDRQQAIQNLARRTDLAPFKTLVGALIQTEKMGSSLTDTLRVLAEDYRMRRLMDAENRAGKLPALMTIPLIFCFLPALFLIIIGPVIIKVKSL